MTDGCIPLSETGEVKPLKTWVRKDITVKFRNGVVEEFQNYIISYHGDLITLTDEEYHTLTYPKNDLLFITENEITVENS